ncbi:hypothetical protein [Gemmatimonas sp.]|uniref:hypothetical protein n=1 Tax=Gemmatimonas sp. TaxID=1962908 RepID=UPI003DA409B6
MFALFTRLIVVPVSLSISSPTARPVALLSDVAATTAAQTRRDSMTVTIAPAKRIEVKLVMKKGEKATFEVGHERRRGGLQPARRGAY